MRRKARRACSYFPAHDDMGEKVENSSILQDHLCRRASVAKVECALRWATFVDEAQSYVKKRDALGSAA